MLKTSSTNCICLSRKRMELKTINVQLKIITFDCHESITAKKMSYIKHTNETCCAFVWMRSLCEMHSLIRTATDGFVMPHINGNYFLVQ